MTPAPAQTRPLAAPAAFGLFALLALLFGLSQVGWHLPKLPGWYFSAALAVGAAGVLGTWLTGQDRPSRPVWQRVLLRGLGWVLPVAGLIAAGEVLDGTWQNPAAFALVWGVMGLGFGWVSLALERRAAAGSRTAKSLKDWF